MKLQIKSLSGELQEDQKKYVRKRVLWLDKHLPNNAELTVGVKEHITKKSNQAFELVMRLFIPDSKKPVYVRVFKNSFIEAVDLAEGKVEGIVTKEKDRHWFKFRIPQIIKRRQS
jgi:ribosome-associated translation inhibitor RaiA